MDLTVHIPDESVPALKAKASGLPLETFAEQVLLERIHSTTADGPGLERDGSRILPLPEPTST